MADEEVVEEEPDIVHVGSGKSGSGLSPIEPAKPIAPPKYDVRPGLGEKFQKENVREIIVLTMSEQLSGRQYRAEQAPKWAKSISNAVRQRVQELDMKRYKILVQTTIVEMKGAGIKSVQRCIWDPETDSYADDLYRNDSIFCYTVVYDSNGGYDLSEMEREMLATNSSAFQKARDTLVSKIICRVTQLQKVVC